MNIYMYIICGVRRVCLSDILWSFFKSKLNTDLHEESKGEYPLVQALYILTIYKELLFYIINFIIPFCFLFQKYDY